MKYNGEGDRCYECGRYFQRGEEVESMTVEDAPNYPTGKLVEVLVHPNCTSHSDLDEWGTKMLSQVI